MKFTEIYNRAIEYWPDEIPIDDGHPTGSDGFRFPVLTKVWDDIEEVVDPEDHWANLAVWCMYQAFHSESRQRHQAGQSVFKPREVSKSKVEGRISENLKAEEWVEHRAIYENDLEVS